LGVQPAVEPDESRRRQRVHEALVRWFCENAKGKHVVVVVDDLHVFDDRSLAVLVGLAQECDRLPLNLIMSKPIEVPLADATRVLVDTTASIRLRRLDLGDFTALVRSLFGDVRGAIALAECLHELCGGMPGACMAYAQHLVDQKLVRYERGGWNLPENVSGLE